MGFCLVGYLVENIARQDFSEYCRENIFRPLGMNNTSWHRQDLDTSKVVFGYVMGPSDTVSYRKVQHFGVPGYPEGMLRTTMQDFAKIIAAFMNDGNYEGYQLLQPATVALMLTPQGVNSIPSRGFKVVDIGLTRQIHDIRGEQLYTMNGFSGSIFTNVYFSPGEKKASMFYYTGVSMKNMAGMVDIIRKLHQAVKKGGQS